MAIGSKGNLFSIAGKVAVITGSSRGIGKAIAQELAFAGAKVVISGRKKEACDEVVSELAGNQLSAISIPCNVSQKDDLKHLVHKTMETWGRIDVLVSNAATNPVYGPSIETTEEIFDKIMSTNVRSIFSLCNLVLPQMCERKDGSIIIISSIAAIRGSSNLGAYAISKAAEAQLARNLAVEWGRYNIRVNAIAPGLIKTDFSRALWEDPKTLKQREAMTPLGRIGEPEDIAGLALCLASAAGQYITGQYIVVDGGITIAGGA